MFTLADCANIVLCVRFAIAERANIALCASISEYTGARTVGGLLNACFNDSANFQLLAVLS